MLQRDNTFSSPLEYKDYRAFLMDYWRQKKTSQPSWSYGVWARKLGLRSSSTLIMILKGDRNPGRALRKDFARYFAWSEKEEEYFTDLVRLEKNRHDLQGGLRVLRELEARNPGKDFRLLDLDAFHTISHWYFLALREMVAMPGFREDPDWISERLQFPVRPEKIRDALDTLLRLGILARGPGDRLVTTSTHVDTEADRADEAMAQYHEQNLDHARSAIRVVPSSEREISGGCFPVRTSSLPQIKERIRSFQMELCRDFEARDGERVYQLEVAFFPLTQSPPREEL